MNVLKPQFEPMADLKKITEHEEMSTASITVPKEENYKILGGMT